MPSPVLLAGLRTAAFPESNKPGALLYVPSYLNLAAPALLVYLHGHENCIHNVVRKAKGTCIDGGPLCPVADLIGHLDRSARSALLLVPEVRYYARSSDPGALGLPGALAALYNEVLQHKEVAPLLAAVGASPSALAQDRLTHRVVISHSGGYKAGISLATQGGMNVEELYLLDSLYGGEDQALSFAQAGGRLVNLFTESGGTASRSRLLARALRRLTPRRDLLFNDDRSVPTDADLRHQLVVKRVPTPHSDIPITYIGRLVQSSGLPRSVPLSA